jgi:hypothetical protein
MNRRTSANIERAHALGGIELVASHREEVYSEAINTQWDLAHGLSRISMDEPVLFVGNSRYLIDRLCGPHLIVGVHDGYQDSVAAQEGADILRIDTTVTINREARHLIPVSLQASARIGDRRVLDARSQDVPTARLRLGCPTDGYVIRLRAAGGEIHLIGMAP